MITSISQGKCRVITSNPSGENVWWPQAISQRRSTHRKLKERSRRRTWNAPAIELTLGAFAAASASGVAAICSELVAAAGPNAPVPPETGNLKEFFCPSGNTGSRSKYIQDNLRRLIGPRRIACELLQDMVVARTLGSHTSSLSEERTCEPQAGGGLRACSPLRGVRLRHGGPGAVAAGRAFWCSCASRPASTDRHGIGSCCCWCCCCCCWCAPAAG